jgi:hypothetical protein
MFIKFPGRFCSRARGVEVTLKLLLTTSSQQYTTSLDPVWDLAASRIVVAALTARSALLGLGLGLMAATTVEVLVGSVRTWLAPEEYV